jgi:NADH-quinone oxidoreductase subunit A
VRSPLGFASLGFLTPLGLAGTFRPLSPALRAFTRLPPHSEIAWGSHSMVADYTGVLVFLALGVGLVGSMLGLHLLLGPRREFAEKQEPFECGEKQIVSPRQRYAVKFYLVALLFVIFDVEAIYFYPWAAMFHELSWFGFGAMAVFTVPLVVGLIYEWMKGGLEW